MKVLVRILLAFLLLIGAASAAEWDDPDWLKVQTVNTLTKVHGFRLHSVTSVQNALHYHLEKRKGGSGSTYVTCITSYNFNGSRNVYCYKP